MITSGKPILKNGKTGFVITLNDVTNYKRKQINNEITRRPGVKMRNFAEICAQKYDLAIIGGGIFGASALWEACLRGLKALLIEKLDFCAATSSHHLKMIHGGIRYMQHGDVIRIRESCKERSILFRIAPHLCNPLPIVMPTYGHGIKGPEALRIGCAIFDLLTCDRNWKSSDPLQKIPNCKIWSKEQLLKQFPDVKQENLTGACFFYDGQIYNPPRLGISFILSALIKGGKAINYAEVKSINLSNKKVTGLSVKDNLTGDLREIQVDAILNTCGPWSAPFLKQALSIELDPEPTFSRDFSFVIKKQLHPKYALACDIKSKDSDAIIETGGRHLFTAPWRDCTLVGVWHSVYKHAPDRIRVSHSELSQFVQEINLAYPGAGIKMEDIVRINTGLTLFGSEEAQIEGSMSFGKRSRLEDHETLHGIKGLVSLIGVRATVSRGMAVKALELILAKLGITGRSSTTHILPIYGGNIKNLKDEFDIFQSEYGNKLSRASIKALVKNYGTERIKVIKEALNNQELLEPLGSSNVIKAELINAVKNEMAVHLEDVVFRRTEWGTGSVPQEKDIIWAGDVMGGLLSWDDMKKVQETTRVMELIESKGPWIWEK